MRHLVLLASILFFGCATVPPTSKNSKADYLSKSSNTVTDTYEKVRENLTRMCHMSEGGLSMAGITAEVFPMTLPLVENEERSLGQKNFDSKADIEKRVSEKSVFFLKNKTCFNISLAVLNKGIEAAQFKNWRAKLELADGSMHELVLRNSRGLSSVPKSVVEPMGVTWLNNTYACVDKDFPFDPTFKVHVIPQFGGDQYKGCSVEWSKK